MRTRITQEEAYEFLKSLPKEITLQEFQVFNNKTLHIWLTPQKLRFKFTEEPLPNTYHIKNFRLAYFYKGQESKKRVPLQVGSMALWTTIYQYMAQIKPETRGNQELPFNIKTLKYLGTVDESEGVSNISSNIKMPYRLTHEFLTPDYVDVLFIEDVYDDPKPETSVFYKDKVWEINYLEEDKLRRLASWGQSIESELSKRLKEERSLYYDMLEEIESYDIDYADEDI